MCLFAYLKKRREGKTKRHHLVFVWINYLWFHNNKEGKQSESVHVS